VSRASNPALGIRFVLMAMVAFAVQDGTSKYLASHYPPQFFIMIRYWLFAVFVVLLVSRRSGGLRAVLNTRMPRLQVFRGVLLAAQIVVVVISFDRLGLAETHAIFSVHPLLTTLLAVPILGERIGWRRAGAVVAGFVGVVIILRPGLGLFRPDALIALSVAAMMAVYTVSTRIASRADGSAMPAFFWLGVAGAGALTLVGPFYWTPMRLPDIGWLLVHSIVAMFGHYCLIRALEATEAVRIQPFTYLQMVFAIPVGAYFFGETVDSWVIAGMTVTVCAGLYAIRREYRLMQSARAVTPAVPPPPSDGRGQTGGSSG
jgi:drug/metabolite transporter (DMT)-like permease